MMFLLLKALSSSDQNLQAGSPEYAIPFHFNARHVKPKDNVHFARATWSISSNNQQQRRSAEKTSNTHCSDPSWHPKVFVM